MNRQERDGEGDFGVGDEGYRLNRQGHDDAKQKPEMSKSSGA